MMLLQLAVVTLKLLALTGGTVTGTITADASTGFIAKNGGSTKLTIYVRGEVTSDNKYKALTVIKLLLLKSM